MLTLESEVREQADGRQAEAYGSAAEEVYGQVRDCLDEFYATNRYSRLQEEFGVVRTALQKTSRVHGHHVWRVDQTSHLYNSSYKIHGAANAALVAVERGEESDEPVKVLNLASAGNHGEAGAVVGAVLGLTVHVDAANFASHKKIGLIESHGAAVRAIHDTLGDALERSELESHQPNHAFIPPFNHPDVLAGQAVLGVQLFEDLVKEGVEGHVEVMAAVGGGGHLTGLAFGYRYAAELAAKSGYVPAFAATFYGVQMEHGDATRRAVERYRQGLSYNALDDVFPDGNYDITNDGTFTMPGDLTVRVLADRSVVADILTVTKAMVGRSMEYLSTQLDKKIEPAGALSHAGATLLAQFAPAVRFGDVKRQFVTYVSGANVTDELYEHYMEAVAADRIAEESRRNHELDAYRQRLATGYVNTGLGSTALRRASWHESTGGLKTSVASSPTRAYRAGLIEPMPR